MKGQLLTFVIKNALDFLIRILLPLFRKIIPEDTKYEYILMKRYSEYLASHFDLEINRINKNNRFMLIEKGRFNYEYFNICFLNNVVGLILYSLYKGYTPVISIRSNSTNDNIWDSYFV